MDIQNVLILVKIPQPTEIKLTLHYLGSSKKSEKTHKARLNIQNYSNSEMKINIRKIFLPLLDLLIKARSSCTACPLHRLNQSYFHCFLII